MVGAAWWVAVVFLALQGAVLVPNLWGFRPLRRLDERARDPRRPSVSLLIPARDEARTLPTTLPGWLAQEADEVLVFDDDSSDGTAALLALAEARNPPLRVLRGRPPPRGWNGKNWACAQLAGEARGDVLVFTDADVCWQAGALDAVLADLHASGAGLMSVWPRQRLVSLTERVAVPQVDMVLLAGLPLALVGRTPSPLLAAANGQLMAWRREDYALVGGHRAVRGEVLEDVRLAQRAKAAGVRLLLRLGGDLVQTRMYRGGDEVVEGFAKNVLAAAGGLRWALVALVALNLLAHTLAWPLAAWQPRWLLPAAGSLGLRVAVELRVGRPWTGALLQPLAPLVLTRIAARALRGGPGYAWKGRRYP